MIRFAAGQETSFVVYLDCPSESWSQVATAEHTRASAMRTTIQAAVEQFGTVADVKCDVNPKSAGDTTLVARVSGFRPRADVESTAIDAAIEQRANAGRTPSPLWLRHVRATSNLIFAPVWWGVALADYVAPDSVRSRASAEYRRRLGLVVDEGSVERGTSRAAPPASSSVLGRALTTAGGEARSSTDPARDGQTPAAASAAELGSSVPPWLVVGGVVLASLVGVGVLAYGARTVVMLTD